MELKIDDLITVQQALSMSIKELESKTPSEHLVFTSHKHMKELLDKVDEEVNTTLHKKPHTK